MHALCLQRLHNPQHVAGAGFVVQQDGDHAAFNRATRHGIQAQRRIFLHAVNLFRRGKIALLVGQRNAQVIRNALGELNINARQMIDHTLADVGTHHFAQLKAEAADNVLLLNRRLAVPEQARMGVILAERRAALANFVAVDTLLVRFESTAFRRRRRFARPVIVDGVRLIVRRIGINILTVHPVALEIVVWAGWAVNRNFVEVRPAQTADLRIGIREQTSLQERIVGEVQPRHDMPRVERGLFVFGKEIIRVAVEHHFTHQLNRHQLFRDQLRRVKQVEIELKFVLLRNELQAQFILREVARFNGLPQLAAMEIRIAPGQLLRLVPHQRGFTRHRLPVETDERGFTLGVDQTEGMDAKAFHGAIAARNAAV